jgi:uncharacterized membrane-anchored protein
MAEALVERRPAAIVNTAPWVSGRYPNKGPGILLEAGVPLLGVSSELPLLALTEGGHAELHGPELWLDGEQIATGALLTPSELEERLEAARANLTAELRAFSRNTLEYLEQETALAFAELPVPELTVTFRNRPVLVVVRGEGYKQDLRCVQPYIREQQPVLVGVDGGADALLEAGHRPHLIVGDMDSATDSALRCGAELVLHTYADGRATPSRDRLEQLGRSWLEVAAPGTSEDLAMLLAHQGGASLIVAVGTHFSLVEFLDKRRAGMASTFLTRLRVGSTLVDAKGLAKLYRPGMSQALVVALVVSALTPIVVVIANSAGLQRWLGLLGMSLEVWLRRHGLR